MALRVEIIVEALGPPKNCSAQALRFCAMGANNVHANRPNNVGVTQAVLHVGCHLDWREVFAWQGQRQCQVASSTLFLRLSQTVYLLETLPQPVKGAWFRHELLHVLDNERIVRTELEPALRQDAYIRGFLVEGTQWVESNADARQEYYNEITPTVQMVFQRLSMTAVQQRDTAAEYARFDNLARWAMGMAPATPTRQPVQDRQQPQRQGR